MASVRVRFSFPYALIWLVHSLSLLEPTLIEIYWSRDFFFFSLFRSTTHFFAFELGGAPVYSFHQHSRATLIFPIDEDEEEKSNGWSTSLAHLLSSPVGEPTASFSWLVWGPASRRYCIESFHRLARPKLSLFFLPTGVQDPLHLLFLASHNCFTVRSKQPTHTHTHTLKSLGVK